MLLRLLARNPALTLIAVVSIALGTGANVAIFSVADALLLRPLPVLRPGELLTLGFKIRHGTVYQNYASYPDYLDIRDHAQSFSGVVAFDYETVGVAVRAGEAPRVRFATFITDNFFSVLGIEPQLGRGFRADEDGKSASGAVAILSDAVWRADFGASQAVLGSKIRIAGAEFTIVGVAPEQFTGLHPYVRDSLFLPLPILPRVVDLRRPNPLDARDMRIVTVKGRLRPGVSVADAQAELAGIGHDLERSYPETNKDRPLIAQTEFEYKLEQRPLDSALVLVLTILSIAVLCVACANVAGLLASRGPVRAREMALRLALGASRARLIRHLLAESLAMAVAGAAGGLIVAHIGVGLLRQIQFPTDIVSVPRFELDQRTFAFSLGVAILSAVLVGLGPALQTTRVDLSSNLKSTDTRDNARRRLTGRAVLVAAQVALSLVVLTIAVFSVQFFRDELIAGPGFRTAQMAKITVDAGQAGYTAPEAARFFTEILDDARALPGVRSASLTSAMPLFSFQFVPILPEGRALPDGQQGVPVWANSIDDRYFETMDIRLVAGRVFASTDDANGPHVAIVNDTLARHYWPDGDVLGKRVHLVETSGAERRLVDIVGVVRTTQLGFPGELPQDGIFFPYRQQPRGQMVLLAHTAGESASVIEPLRDLVRRLDHDVPVFDGQTIETFYGARVTVFGNVMIRLIGAMGLMGMGLTMVGLYGLVSYSVSRRTREIGIRIAVGATYARILTMVLRQGMRPAWIGVIAGLGLSVMTARMLLTFVPLIYHVDASTYYVVVPIVIVVTLAATFVPARRAARVNPMTALRYE